jgi:membrane-bound ClpP family serine protease
MKNEYERSITAIEGFGIITVALILLGVAWVVCDFFWIAVFMAMTGIRSWLFHCPWPFDTGPTTPWPDIYQIPAAILGLITALILYWRAVTYKGG